MGMMDELDAPQAEAWMAEDGDKIVGTVTHLSTRTTEYGTYPIATLDVSEGTIKGEPIPVPATLAVHLMGTVVCSEIGFDRDKGDWGPDRRLYVDCELGLKKLGKPAGKNYEAWNVIVKKPSTADRLDDDAGHFG
jgi:hypothetical protein